MLPRIRGVYAEVKGAHERMHEVHAQRTRVAHMAGRWQRACASIDMAPGARARVITVRYVAIAQRVAVCRLFSLRHYARYAMRRCVC